MSNRNVAYALMLIIAVLIAAASLYLLLTSLPPGEGSAEAGFARDMMVHHAQAVEMAEIVRFKTESAGIRTLANDIALTQQAQIGQMQGWLGVWGLPATGTEPAMSWMGHPTRGRMPGMATPEEIGRLEDAPPAEADRQFLYLMIRHHRGAIPMAEAVLEHTDRPEVRQLAQAIAATQRQEIRLMEEMPRDRQVRFAEVPLVTIESSGVSGSAAFEDIDGGVRVELEVEGLPKPGTTYLAHIHPGTCGGVENGGGHEHSEGSQHSEQGADHGEGHRGQMETGQPMGEIEAPLTPLEADAEGRASSTTVVHNTTVDGLFSGASEYVNVHAGGSGSPPPLACANLNHDE
jgi:uncharacterized protein (DUF305 family)